MSSYALGIRGKLDLGLGIVLLVATFSFTVVYAELERRTALAIEREHLLHFAELTRSLLEDAEGVAAIQAQLDALGRRFRDVGGLPHRLVVRAKEGSVLASFDPESPPSEAGARSVEPRERETFHLRPSEMTVTIPWGEEGEVARSDRLDGAVLTVSEPVPRVARLFRESVARHFGFAVVLVGLTLFACSLLVNRLILRPLRQMVRSTDEFARGGEWSPIVPRGRRRDEIGVLGDRLAAMSRRLFEAVREERYHTAHLVGARAHRELEEPLRRVSMHLVVLEKLVSAEPEAARVLSELAQETERIRATAWQLGLLPDRPER